MHHRGRLPRIESSFSFAAAFLVAALGVGCASSTDAERSNETKTTTQASSPDEASAEAKADERAKADDEVPARRKASNSKPEPPEDNQGRRPAAERPTPSQPNPAEETDGSVSDEELEKFAAVSKRLDKVRLEMKHKMQNAEDRAEAEEIQKAADERLKSILADENMSRAEYTQLAQQIRSDPELQQRLKEVAEGN